MRRIIYNVYVSSLLPLMLCIGSTTVMTGEHQGSGFHPVWYDMSQNRYKSYGFVCLVEFIHTKLGRLAQTSEFGSLF